MKTLLISSSDLDGGAARAAYRLHQGLQAIGSTAQLLVRDKSSADNQTIQYKPVLAKLATNWDTLPLKLYPKRDRTMFAPHWFPDAIAPKVAELQPDIINLHWCGLGYLNIETMARFKQPLVWTLHDMWAFTGGCCYTQECDRYQDACGACPKLKSKRSWDLSRWIWHRKAQAWKNLDLTLVTPSKWLASCAQSSSLFRNSRVEVIPNGLDIQTYKPIPQQMARQILNLPQDKQLVLFGAGNSTGDRRKGFQFLVSALQALGQSEWRDRIELIVFGASSPKQQPDLGFKCHYLGKLSDDTSLAIVYAAANVFVAPSTQDNLPNTVMEALACGTPCVAFNIGGLPDMIDHQKNGYLAQPFDIEDLAQGIRWVLQDSELEQLIRVCARQKVEKEFTQELQAQRYQALFEELLKRSN